MSVVVHALLIAGAAVATRPSAGAPREAIYNRVYYVPPPNARPQQPFSEEHLEYVQLSVPGPTAGTGASFDVPLRDDGGNGRGTRGARGRDYAMTPRTVPVPGTDSVYTEVEVDNVAVRFQWSAAPQYPLDLLKKQIEGMARVQYVVDTTGFADTATFRVIHASDTGFAVAVRAALPAMRFAPARIGEQPVRQLVEQEFTFRINRKEVAKAERKKIA